MTKDVHDFFERLKKDPEFKNEFKKVLEVYPERDILCSFSFDEQIMFIYEVVIPFARRHGFDFNLEDIVTENSKNIDDKYLDKIAGGTNLATKLSASALTAVQALTMISPANAVANGITSSQPEISYVSSSEKEDDRTDYGDILDVLEENSKNMHHISDGHPFNEVDRMIFATLAYLLMNIVPNLDSNLENKEITLSQWCERLLKYFNSSDKKLKLHTEDDHNISIYNVDKNSKKEHDIMQIRRIQLLKNLSKCPRYKNIKVGNFRGKYSYVGNKDYEQFAAVTLTLENGTKVVSFRGTDGTLSGWKEDLDLSWSKQVPAQKDALEYLEKIYELNPNSDFIVTGHSKGGNLAIYSSFYMCSKNEDFRSKLKNILNYDGPGLSESITSNLDTGLFNDISTRLTTFIPQSSVIGRIMNDISKGKFVCVHSFSKGIFYQHDSLSWSVYKDYENSKDKFRSYEIQPESEFAAEAISIFLDNLDKEKAMGIFLNWFFRFMNDNNIEIDDKRSKSQIFKEVFYNYFIRGKSLDEIIDIVFHPEKVISISKEEQESFKNVMTAVLKGICIAYWHKRLEMNKKLGFSSELNASIEKMINDEYSITSMANVIKVLSDKTLSIENIWKFIKMLYS